MRQEATLISDALVGSAGGHPEGLIPRNDLRSSGQPPQMGRERRNVLQIALEAVRKNVLVETGRNGVLTSWRLIMSAS